MSERHLTSVDEIEDGSNSNSVPILSPTKFHQNFESKQQLRTLSSINKIHGLKEQMQSPKKRTTLNTDTILSEVPVLQLSQIKDGSSMKSPPNLKKSKTSAVVNSVSRYPTDNMNSHRASQPSQIQQTGQNHNVKVVIRVRPINEREKQSGSQKSCIIVEDNTKIVLDRGIDQKNFTFDFVADQETGQEEIFQRIAQPIADSCLQGYNGTIFAYGQTGSGKTFTIQGPAFTSANGDEQLISSFNSTGIQLESRGLMQRSFEHIFSCIDREKNEAEINGSEVKYLIKSSYLEIYNEQVMDLLDPSSINLHVREDIKTGVYVEGLLEEPITCVKDMIALITRGSRNRHVGSTSMNKESSRSHSVLTTLIESKTMTAGGVWQMKSSCFHIIDLAGSERSKHTNAEGQRLKEAGMINKSLSALGIVINSLVDISEGKTRHVHYRDSKLTFLLRDSLGGNSKTVIIANITQAQISQGETLSTLQFAQRAKLIKNKAVINEESSGTIQILKNEIRRLKQEMAEMQQNQRLIQIEQKSSNNELNDSESTICALCRAVNSTNNDVSFHDEMLVEKKTNTDPTNSVQRVMQLENLLSANLENLTNQHKYFEQEADKKTQSYKRLQQAMEAVDKQSQRDKMIIKFRDQRIQKLEQTLAQSGQEKCQQCELNHEQLQQITRERDEWKDMHEKQTSTLAAKLFAEKEELIRQNQILTNEIHQTPESLTAQLRSFNELTDSLSRYLKNHCEEKASDNVTELENVKNTLQEQVTQLQMQLEQQVTNNEQLLNQVNIQHKQEVTLLQEKFTSLQEKSKHEQQQLQTEAAEQISQIKRDLQALSQNEEEFARQQINSVQRQNDLQAKVVAYQALIDESNLEKKLLSEKVTVLQEQLEKGQLKLQQADDDHKLKFKNLNQQITIEKEAWQAKLKLLKDQHDNEMQQIQTTLLLEQSQGDTLRECETELRQNLSKIEQQNEDLQKNLMLNQETISELTAQARDLENRLCNNTKDFQQKLNLCQTEFVSVSTKLDSVTKQKLELETTVLITQQDNQKLRDNVAETKSELDQIKQSLNQVQKNYSDMTEQSKLEQINLEKQVSFQRETLKSAFESNSQQQLQISDCIAKIQNLQNENSDLKQKNDQMCQDFMNQLNQKSQQIQRLQRHNESLQTTIEKLEEECKKLQTDLDGVQSQARILHQLTEELKEQNQRTEKQFQQQIQSIENKYTVETEQLQQKYKQEKESQAQELSACEIQLEQKQKLVTKMQTDFDLQKQKLLNQQKTIELENMQYQGQVLLLRSEYEQAQQSYQRKLEQIENTVKSTLDVEKETTKQELQLKLQESLSNQENELKSQLKSEYQQQLKNLQAQHELEILTVKQQLQNQRLLIINQLQTRMIEIKAEYANFKNQIVKKLQWNNISPSPDQLLQIMQILGKPMITHAVHNEEIQSLKNIHQKALQTQQIAMTTLKSEISENLEQLKEYRGLTTQLQSEKQTQIKNSNTLCQQLKEAETKLIEYYNQHEESIKKICNSNREQLSEKEATIQAMKTEMDTLRNQLIDLSTELARQKSKSQDLNASLKQSKDTISGLVQKENALLDELQGKMNELGANQDQWKQKVNDQKKVISDMKRQYELLQQKFELVCQSREQLMNSTEVKQNQEQMSEEINQLRNTVQKRELEIKEIVRALKKLSDEKKSLESENAMLHRKANDNSEGHMNLQQKIQHHLKIKEENNKLREENYSLKEEIRKKLDTSNKSTPTNQNNENLDTERVRRETIVMIDFLDQLVQQILQLPGCAQFLRSSPQLNETLRWAQQQSSSSQHATQQFKCKAQVMSEIIGNTSRMMQSIIDQQNRLLSNQQNQIQQHPQKVSQPSQGNNISQQNMQAQQRIQTNGVGSSTNQQAQSAAPQATLNLSLMSRQQYLHNPQQSSQHQDQGQKQQATSGIVISRPPSGNQNVNTNIVSNVISGGFNQQEKENKVNQAAAFLNSVQQRSNSQRK